MDRFRRYFQPIQSPLISPRRTSGLPVDDRVPSVEEACPELYESDSMIGPDDMVLMVTGLTGSGKSTFIENCTDHDITIGHGLDSCTRTIQTYTFTHAPSGRRIHLLDTPGFNDSCINDAQILAEHAFWLNKAYANNIRLSGIIYLHSITSNRIQGSTAKNLRLLKAICGDDCLDAVVLTANMWNRVEAVDGENRERELVQTREFWGAFVDGGSVTARVDDTAKSALAVVDYFAQRNSKIKLRLQVEMVEQQRSLGETSAGREIEGSLEEARAAFDREKGEIERRWDSNGKGKGDRETRDLVLLERKCREDIRTLEEALSSLRIKHEGLLELKEMAHLAEIRKLQEEREQYQVLIKAKVHTLKELEMKADSTTDEKVVEKSPSLKEVDAVEKLKPEIVSLQRSRAANKERIGQILRQNVLFGEGRSRRFDDVSSGTNRTKKTTA